MSHSITLINMDDGSVAGHKAGCADIKKQANKFYSDDPWTFEVSVKHDAWLEYNMDFIQQGEDAGTYPIGWRPCAKHVSQGAEDEVETHPLSGKDNADALAEALTVPEPKDDPAATPMTKTEAYSWVKRSREGLRDADASLYKGTADQVREALMETIGAATMLLDALENQGIKGL